MGGREFGEVASSLCISTLNTSFKKYFPSTLRGRALDDGPAVRDVLVQLLDTWIRDMNAVIWDFGTVDHKYREMGTTLALLYQQEDFVALAHVGDSRIYRVRGGAIEQVTDDHSFVNSQLKAKLITLEEAAMSAHKNIITRAIGTRSTVKADITLLRVEPGDLFLLCSDGLSDLVEAQDVLAALDEVDRDLAKGVDALVDLANARGGTDNITVILARVDAEEDVAAVA